MIHFTVPLMMGLCFLLVLSIWDFLTYNKKKGYIPAVLTTLFLLLGLILNGEVGLYLGAVASLIALLFTDLDVWQGIADFKSFVAVGIILPSLASLLTFACFVSIISVIIKFIFLIKIKKLKFQIPFIPIMLISFVLTWVMIQ